MFSISFINLPTAHSFYQIENFAAVARNYVCNIALSYHVLRKKYMFKEKEYPLYHIQVLRAIRFSNDFSKSYQRSLIIWPMTEEFSFLFPSGVFILTV